MDEAIHVFLSKAYSPICFAEMFFDLLKPCGTIAMMTSRMGNLTLVASVAGLYGTLANWHGSGKQAFLDYQGNELPW